MTKSPLIEIFRPGSFTSVEGVEVSFSETDLRGVAEGYDPSTDPAPLVVGHPKLDAPAYGWVDSVRFEDGRLVAQPKDVEPSFAELVNAGRYRRVSARFYQPDSPDNPKPGRFYLKHIGFLGAHPPAVKGLKTVSFGEAGDDGLTIDTDPPSQETHVATPDEASFAERASALDARETEIAAREQAAGEQIRKVRHDANLSFAETLVTAGKLAPAGRDLVVGIMDELDSDKVVSFGEANGELTAAAAFRKLFDAASPIVSFGEAAGRDKEAEEDTPAPTDLAAQAVAFAEEERKAGRAISAAAAVRHVQAQAAK